MEPLDKIDWDKFRLEVRNKVSLANYKLVCKLHAKYYNHPYYEPCTCNAKKIKKWIAELNDKYEQDTND